MGKSRLESTVTITGIYQIDVLPLRKQYRILAKDLAKRAGITGRSLSNIERGKATPHVDTYINLVKALNEIKSEREQNDKPAA